MNPQRAPSRPRRIASAVAIIDIDEPSTKDVPEINTKEANKELEYWKKPDVVAFIDWITDPELFPRFKDPRGVAGKSKNEIYKEIATYINATIKPTKPLDYLAAKSRYQVIKGKYDKARELLGVTGSGDTEDEALMDKIRAVCSPFERLHYVLKANLSMDGPEAYQSSRKHNMAPEDEPSDMEENQEGSSDGKVSTGNGKRYKKEVPAFLNADLSALQNQAGALQEKAMEAAFAREKYLSERERDHSLKLLRTEAETNALLHQRRKDLEEYYQYRVRKLESNFKERNQVAEAELKERSQRAEAELKERSQRADAEYRRRFEDFMEEKRLFYEQQRRFEELRTGLERRLASQWNSELNSRSTNALSNPGTHQRSTSQD
ncbi:hypothetical protein CPC16_011964 [Podila verticillata]|nr:hypothetical protein CPC16_011964 [Podila verticillata]KAI9236480.1 MAG: hypothetical protein BYD32DRAFT_418726 [Podila humilis]